MAIITYSGGKTYSGETTSTLREVPLFKNFPSYAGSAKNVNITTTFRVNSPTTYTFTIYLFKTFKYNSSYWTERSSDTGYSYDCFYQYPNNTSYYLNSSNADGMIEDVLASKTVTEIISTGDYTFSLDLTDFGKNLSNWTGDICLGIVASGSLYWGNGSISTITIEKSTGTIKYGIGNTYVDCELYYGNNNKWTPVETYYGINDSYIQITN